MNSVMRGALSSSLKSEILFFRTGSSSRSLRVLRLLGGQVHIRTTYGRARKEDGVTTKEEPSFTAWDRTAKGSLVEITRGKIGEAASVWTAARITPSRGVGVLAEMGVISLTLSVWVPSFLGTGSEGGVRASVGTPCAAVEGASGANATLAPSKKPSIGTPMEVESSLVVGWYTERGSGLS